MWYNRPATVAVGRDAIIGWTSGNDRSVRVARVSGTSGRVQDVETLHKWRYADDHGSPALHRIGSGPHAGRILAVYALHNSELYARRSATADGHGWEPEQRLFNCECSYPAILETGGTIYLFYGRNTGGGTRSYFFRASRDGGDSFGPEQLAVGAAAGQWIYALPFVDAQKRIDLVWDVQEPRAMDIHDFYFARLGQTAGAQPVYRSPSRAFTRAWDVRLAADGRPTVLTIDYVGEDAMAHWRKLRADGSWLDVPLGRGAFAYYPCGAVFAGDAETVWVARIGGLEELKVDEAARNSRRIGWIASRRGAPLCRPTSLGGDGVAASEVLKILDNMHFQTPLVAMVPR
jgi:hypothetical protein